MKQAERVGFEPTIPFRIRVFETRALGQLCDLSKTGQIITGIPMKDKLDELRQMRAKAKLDGGERRIAESIPLPIC